MELDLKIGSEEAVALLTQRGSPTSGQGDGSPLGDYSLRVRSDGSFRLGGKGTRSQRDFPFEGRVLGRGEGCRIQGRVRISGVARALVIVLLGAAMWDVALFGWAMGLGGAMCILAFWLLVFIVLGLSGRHNRRHAEDQDPGIPGAGVLGAHAHRPALGAAPGGLPSPLDGVCHPLRPGVTCRRFLWPQEDGRG